jgi:hypothetical protein
MNVDNILHCRLYKHNKVDPSKQPIVLLSDMFCTKSVSMTRPSDMLQNLIWLWSATPWCPPPCGTTAPPWLSTVTRTLAALHREPLSSAGGKSTWARTITWGQWHSLSTRVSRNKLCCSTPDVFVMCKEGYLKETIEHQLFKNSDSSCISSMNVFSRRFCTPRTSKYLFTYSLIMCVLYSRWYRRRPAVLFLCICPCASKLPWQY